MHLRRSSVTRHFQLSWKVSLPDGSYADYVAYHYTLLGAYIHKLIINGGSVYNVKIVDLNKC